MFLMPSFSARSFTSFKVVSVLCFPPDSKYMILSSSMFSQAPFRFIRLRDLSFLCERCLLFLSIQLRLQWRTRNYNSMILKIPVNGNTYLCSTSILSIGKTYFSGYICVTYGEARSITDHLKLWDLLLES